MLLLKLIFKNAFRHRLRAGLTILSITIAILAFSLLQTVIGAWYAGVDRASASRLITRNAISMTFTMPLSYREKIAAVPGVVHVAYGSWFGGIYIDEKNFFPSIVVEPRSYFALYPEYVLAPDEGEAFFRDRSGFVAGRKLADRFGWRVGDTITLKGTVYPGTWDLVLRAIYRGRDANVDEGLLFLHWAYVNETMRKTAPSRADLVGLYMVGVDRPEAAPDVAAAIDAVFKNSLAETLTETEKAFNLSFISMTEAIIMVIRLVSLAVIVIIIAVAANTMSMTVRERTGEFAVLKTLGFGGWRVGGLILGESLVITMAGGLFGILLAFPAAGLFKSLLGNYFRVFNLSSRTLWLDGLACLLVGAAAAIIPLWRATTIRIAEGLRSIG
jgi:putative ABC transport system permease protein